MKHLSASQPVLAFGRLHHITVDDSAINSCFFLHRHHLDSVLRLCNVSGYEWAVCDHASLTCICVDYLIRCVLYRLETGVEVSLMNH